MLGNMVSYRNFLKWYYIQLPLWFKWLGRKKAIHRGMDKIVCRWCTVAFRITGHSLSLNTAQFDANAAKYTFCLRCYV
jgi:hypothetical protein